jgi:hypothetical protein
MINIVNKTIPFSTDFLSSADVKTYDSTIGDVIKPTGLKLWIAADKINRPIGTQVDFCYDLSSNENHLTKFTSSSFNPPLLRQQYLMPSLFFSSYNCGLQSLKTTLDAENSGSSGSHLTVFLVIARYTTGGMYFWRTTPGGIDMYSDETKVDLNLQGNFALLSVSNPMLTNKIYLITAIYDHTSNAHNVDVRINGVNSHTTRSNFTINGSIFQIGESLYADVFEVMFFNRGLPQGEVEKIEQYLNRKYSIF